MSISSMAALVLFRSLKTRHGTALHAGSVVSDLKMQFAKSCCCNEHNLRLNMHLSPLTRLLSNIWGLCVYGFVILLSAIVAHEVIAMFIYVRMAMSAAF